jgi:MarR family transcriptional regulator, organic hydroperoxide resistance regulator
VFVCYIYAMSTSTVSSTAAREAWALFWRIFTADKPRRMSTLNDLGLAPMQSMALMQLRPGEPMPMSALANALMCDNSNVTGIVDRLEAQGLVERRPSEHDRRVKTLVVTPKGIELRGQVERRMSEPPPPLAGLSDEDAATLRDILTRALEV